jgi:hypothetical protein
MEEGVPKMLSDIDLYSIFGEGSKLRLVMTTVLDLCVTEEDLGIDLRKGDPFHYMILDDWKCAKTIYSLITESNITRFLEIFDLVYDKLECAAGGVYLPGLESALKTAHLFRTCVASRRF